MLILVLDSAKEEDCLSQPVSGCHINNHFRYLQGFSILSILVGRYSILGHTFLSVDTVMLILMSLASLRTLMRI